MCKLHKFSQILYFWIYTIVYIGFICFGFATITFGSLPHHPLESAEDVVKLPFCGNDSNKDFSRRLLFVSTLDGKLSALDLADGGSIKWTMSTAPGGLLSSSIHRLELTNNGQWVRMIPSLNGGLYKFDGDTIEPIPVSADHLLSASYKFSDDLVISGGKETRSYGISSRTGRIVYECSMNGCRNLTNLENNNLNDDIDDVPYNIKTTNEHDPLVDEVVVVRRQTQTVRAVEPRTGGERWNFSVGHHEVDVMKAENCHNRPYTKLEKSLLNIQLKVIVPEGIVCAVDKENPNMILWQYKFDHPIVNAWKIGYNDKLENIDLFSYSHWPWNLDEMPHNYETLSPSLYVGMFKKQLYIQESLSLKKTMHQTNIYASDYITGKTNKNDSMAASVLKIPWKPLPATSSGLMLLQHDKTGSDQEPNIKVAAVPSVTALSVLYGSEYVNGNGFFLYSSDDLNRTFDGHCDQHGQNNSSDFSYTDNEESFEFHYSMADTPVKIVIVSMWWWWKQIIVISMITALILNIFLSRRIPHQREVVIVERHVEVKVPVVIQNPELPDTSNDQLHNNNNNNNNNYHQTHRSNSESSHLSSGNFTSRFSTDFDLIQRLGTGGFGVVFEARNKLDDCNYAIKRIILPNRQESRDRVLREVKTLAHCEHQHIVRYFQAWVEQPPSGWQENEDKLWMDSTTIMTHTNADINSHSHSIDIPPTPTDDGILNRGTTSGILLKQQKVINEVINKNQTRTNLDEWISNLHTNECINFDDSIRKTKFATDTMTDEDDSFIQFKNTQSLNDNTQMTKNNAYSTSIDYNAVDICCTEIKYKNENRICHYNGIIDNNSNESSYEIEFKNDNGCQYNGNNKCDKNKIDSCLINFINHDTIDSSIMSNHNINNNKQSYQKHRTQSESKDHISSINTNSDKNSGIVLVSDNTTDMDSNKVVMKKTHKRPLSLDLSKAPGIVNFQHQPSNKVFLYIQMQLCQKQSLKDWLRNTGHAERQMEIVPIFRQIVNAVEYVHLKGLIHRDLKPGNILFSLNGQIKIGDFGLVTDMPSFTNQTAAILTTGNCTNNIQQSSLNYSLAKQTQKVGTYLYMSPEQLLGQQYNYKVDIYSLGFIFFELLVVFGTEMERIETLKSLRTHKFPDHFSEFFPDEYNLLKIMLATCPSERPTTIGIRSRPPLGTGNLSTSEWDFDLPPRRRDSKNSN